MKKDIIFYSLLCEYSKEVIELVRNKKMEEELIFIDIEDENIEIPDFITVVPTIYVNADKTLVIDEEIINWLNNKEKEIQNNEENRRDIGGFDNDSFSINFSNLNDNEEINNSTDFFSNINENITINTSDESNNKKDFSRSLDSYQQQRQKDMQEIFSK